MLDIYLRDGRVINLRKPLIILVSLLVLLILGIFLYIYLTTGQLVITTNNKNNLIEVTRTYNYNQHIFGKTPASITAIDNKSVRLAPGNYTVTVSSPSFSTQQIAQVKARKSLHLTINLDKVSTLEPVAGEASDDVIASSNQLLYINPTNDNLYEYSGQNNIQDLDDSHQITSVDWANTSFGIGQDISGNFYSISNGVVSPLSLPFSYKPSPLTPYAVAPNEEIYIATGGNLYKGTVGGSFNSIASLSSPVSVISASNQGVAFFEGIDNDDENAKTSEVSLFYVINSNGQVFKSTEGEVNQVAWSKTGKYIATMDNGQLVIWNSSLKELVSLPENGITSLAWLDDNTLFYGLKTGIWSYSLQSRKSVLVSQSTIGQDVTDVSPSADGSSLYVSLADLQQPTVTYELAKVGLHSQPVPNLNLLVSLSALLPNTVNGCSLNYLNFSGPAVLIQGTQQLQQSCTQTAQTYLKGYDVNTNQINFQFTGD